MTIRSATLADAEPVAALCRQLGYAVNTRTMRARLQTVLGRARHLVIVAEEKSAGLGGWLHACATDSLESGQRVEIVGLVVAASQRRKGTGKRLVTRAGHWAEQKKIFTMVVRSNIKRAESHKFYLALNYKAAKTQVVYQKHLDNH